jgi:putative transposase
VVKNKKSMGVQQVLLSPDNEIKAILEYLCQQSGKLYNSGVYFARQTFFKTGKLLTGKFDLAYEPSVAKTMVAQRMFEKWYSVIFITLLPPLVPPLQGGKQ